MRIEFVWRRRCDPPAASWVWGLALRSLRPRPAGRGKEDPMVESLKPKDPAEAVAVFRAQVIGSLSCRDPESHGELADALRQ